MFRIHIMYSVQYGTNGDCTISNENDKELKKINDICYLFDMEVMPNKV